VAVLHQKLAVFVVLLALAGVIWSGLRLSGPVSGRLAGFAWLVVAVTGVEALSGAVAGLSGGRPADMTHLVFGPLTLLALPVALALRRGRDVGRASGILFAGWLVMLALGLRALGTGGLG
jgi:hypothetical protein